MHATVCRTSSVAAVAISVAAVDISVAAVAMRLYAAVPRHAGMS
jgi:hypothetical protein